MINGTNCGGGLCLYTSAWLCLVLALMEMSFGVTMLFEKDKITSNLRNEKESIGLSDSKIDEIDLHSEMLGYGFLSLSAMEVLRFFASRLVQRIVQKQSMYQYLSAKENDHEENRQSKMHAYMVNKKYSALRDKYREKWTSDRTSVDL